MYFTQNTENNFKILQQHKLKSLSQHQHTSLFLTDEGRSEPRFLTVRNVLAVYRRNPNTNMNDN